nr:MAG TPA: RNA polymerase sigma factor [Caudoviricetes sp.]
MNHFLRKFKVDISRRTAKRRKRLKGNPETKRRCNKCR